MNILLTILSLTFSGSIFIVILFLCKPLYVERLSKRWQYYIWLIVIVRLLLPLSLEVNFVGNAFNEISQSNIIIFEEVEAPKTGSEAPNTVNNGGTISSGMDSEIQAAPPFPQYNIFTTMLPNLWFIWLLVAIVLFVRKITIYQSFVRYTKAGCVEVSGINNLERFGKIVEEINIKGAVGIYTNSLISSPLLIGFFRPYIVLPTLGISESDFRYTILHELTHYKRGDMFYKWLVQLAICLHWFNPLVYLMGREINKACEFSCDESVIRNLDYHGIRAYGDTLLNALGVGGVYRGSLSSVTLFENKKILKERLDMIMKFKKKSRLAVVIALCATMVLSMGATVAGAYTMVNPSTAANEIVREAIGTDEEGIPIISGDFSFEIPYIAPDEVVLVGRVLLSPDNPFSVIVSAEDSGYGFFMALNDSPHIQTVTNTMWNPFLGNWRVADGQFNFTSDRERTAYLYIGGGLGGLEGNVSFTSASRFGSGSLTNITGRIYRNNEESVVNDTQAEESNDMNVVIQTNGSRQTVEIGIPQIYTTNLFVPYSPIFIESVILHPGDIITFDIYTDVGFNPFIGFSSVKFSDPTNQVVHIAGGGGRKSGTLTIDGDESKYIFVFVHKDNNEPVDTYFRGTIVIERANSN